MRDVILAAVALVWAAACRTLAAGGGPARPTSRPRIDEHDQALADLPPDRSAGSAWDRRWDVDAPRPGTGPRRAEVEL